MNENYRYILKALQDMFASTEEINYKQKEKKNYLSGPVEDTQCVLATPATRSSYLARQNPMLKNIV